MEAKESAVLLIQQKLATEGTLTAGPQVTWVSCVYHVFTGAWGELD